MHRQPSFPRQQRGAVLYVALIFLILLSLLGIVGMQVASLQERMASNYRATNMAFQRAEGLARLQEVQLNTGTRFVPRAGERDEERRCDDPSPVRGSAWAEARSNDDDPDTAIVVSRLNECTPGFSIAQGSRPVNEKPVIWQISSFSTDVAAAPTSDAAVETVFMP
ncbi:PilX N-terminal domain-containing pilus assembly protein [Lysobacter sp. S4-A87]|uniref:pilus assembly PilX family protein n=1 Tax=Lysobacter sp. S4-A87 TaxID=2925843 RepID=UPI001F53404D|nr:PilX N-terminal domain-containing pilus assembly protein [Lysobacter sp. S4-A87]UNK50595.1 PilX N-terminal domain-containing pilus assembly protein [Lysobacter sp. S4-A87]